MPSSSTVLAAAIQRVCKAAEGWRFHYSKALLMLCIVHGSAVQSLILSHCSLPPLGEVLLQEAYPLGLSCWEPEALELFLNLLPQLQQKHLTFLSKSILGSFLFFFKGHMSTQLLHCQALQKRKQSQRRWIVLVAIQYAFQLPIYKQVSLVLFNHIPPPFQVWCWPTFPCHNSLIFPSASR